MIKKLFTVITLTLALNFLALAGAVGYLFQTGAMTREKIPALKEVIFPKPVEAPATQPSEIPTSQPAMRLEELLAKATGRTASEQVEFIKTAFDAQMAVLDRRQRELVDMQRQVDLAKQQIAKDRSGLEAQAKALDEREKRAAELASDKGFQDSLALYNSMQPNQVKRIFAGLDDQTITTFLQAMQPRKAAAIIKEFTSPDETERMQRILERMRQASASTKE